MYNQCARQEMRARWNRKLIEQVESERGRRALSLFECIASLFFCYIEENTTHCACLSDISMSRHPERCSGGSVTSNPPMHCNFGVKIHCILHPVSSAQGWSTAQCTYAHSVLFLSVSRSLDIFQPVKTLTCKDTFSLQL